MSFASKYNQGRKFSIDTTGYQYMKSADVLAKGGEGITYVIAGLYINTKGNFEPHPVVIIPELEALVDLSQYMTKQVTEILADDEACADIEAGKVGIQFEYYDSKKYKRANCTGCRWVDIK